MTVSMQDPKFLLSHELKLIKKIFTQVEVFNDGRKKKFLVKLGEISKISTSRG